ncbi:hypothetical protein TIFTF001_024762 [Ficus carica]|uniref:Uncharacterized protein n=1 Tax=Ficus carica TaxID=3494 RepID=A0AA88DKF5_FICCA|nr:hypothetical protein TIFTF001_024762 [Ficus carica]
MMREVELDLGRWAAIRGGSVKTQIGGQQTLFEEGEGKHREREPRMAGGNRRPSGKGVGVEPSRGAWGGGIQRGGKGGDGEELLGD